MRILALGYALPNPNIDNYTFAGAPSFFDYDALLVDPVALSRLVEEVAGQAAHSARGAEQDAEKRQHLSNSGEPVVNGATEPFGVGLADLLRRRQEETARLLAQGKPVVCFAHPNVYHHRVAGFTGCDRYFWLPAPGGVQYREPHLLPGDGTQVSLTDEEHPFAAYLRTFADKLAYRAYFSDAISGFDDFGRVFARSTGGAIVGVDLKVDNGQVIFLPPVAEPGIGAQRHLLALTLVDCLRALVELAAAGPMPPWAERYPLPDLKERQEARDEAAAQVEAAKERLDEAESRFQELDRFRRLLWQEGKFGLEAVVREAFRLLGFQATIDPDEPLTLYAGGEKVFVEVEGSMGPVSMAPHYRLRRRLEQAIEATGRPQKGLLIVNGHRLQEPERRPVQYTDALRVAAESMRYCILTSSLLFEAVKRHLEGDAAVARTLRERLPACEGVLDIGTLSDGSPESSSPSP